ncbi:lipopolysaccharide transport periplasmic protein LptA [Paracoccaceae bacterium GXU_MW_L88]
MRLSAPFLVSLALPLAALAQGAAFSGLQFESSDPIEITADQLTVDQATGEAAFEGNVIAAQGPLRLGAGRLSANYDGEEVREITATGQVTLTNGELAAEAAQAVYNVPGAEVVMTGDVLVTQQGNALAGERLVIDLERGTAQMDGRVRSVLTPNQ